MGEIKRLPARQTIVREDSLVTTSTLLVEGFVCRFVDGRNGERQLVAIHVPGDFVDLHSFPLERLDHAVATMTTATVALIPHEALRGLMARHPELARLLWFSTMLDSAISREWIFRLGHLPAIGRVAHLFCELAMRLELVGLGDGNSFPLPLIQSDVADACGLTPEHINRVIRQLREQRILLFLDGSLTILDWDQLKVVAEFDEGYLYIERPAES